MMGTATSATRAARWASILAFCAVTGAVACTSPEADRTRGGGPGADPGNRDAIVELHEGAEPYHETPCRMADLECPEIETAPGT